MTRVLITTLGLLALVQLALLLFVRDGAFERGTLQIGELFPSLDLVAVSSAADATGPVTLSKRDIHARDAVAAFDGCSLVVVASRHCGICLAMRETWQREVDAWSGSLALPIQSHWLFLDPPETLSEFTKHPNMDRVHISSIVGPGHRPGARLLGVFGTPTIFLVDREGLLRIGVMGDLLPTASEAAQWC